MEQGARPLDPDLTAHPAPSRPSTQTKLLEDRDAALAEQTTLHRQLEEVKCVERVRGFGAEERIAWFEGWRSRVGEVNVVGRRARISRRLACEREQPIVEALEKECGELVARIAEMNETQARLRLEAAEAKKELGSLNDGIVRGVVLGNRKPGCGMNVDRSRTNAFTPRASCCDAVRRRRSSSRSPRPRTRRRPWSASACDPPTASTRKSRR